MIHHISIPARQPEHVAKVLAELMQGYAGPFLGPIPGAYVVYADDVHGSGIEIYPEDTVLVAGEGGGSIERRPAGEPPQAHSFHALISVPVQRSDIERIGEREGWAVRHFWRGPPGVELFELYELWIENRVMLELVTADMLSAYVAIANGAAQRALLSRRAAGG
jgi:hypothetical protein